ncbi:MAG: radical SAM family heme chaperone HemW [Flavobacteriales bacterium]|nr:radical SAM family heme chaperone HemW [Flavobacteriales bacterium]
MAGIYLHIPYCKQKCTYCNFHFSTNNKNHREMIKCMEIELSERSDYLKGRKIDTVYFGGGTPSIIDTKYIKRLLDKIRALFPINKNVEITMEFNPDDVDDKKICELKEIGVNRISIGIQSFHNKDLVFMNRSHNAKQAVSAVEIVSRNGIDNITIDLIYGLPGQTNEMWEKNISELSKLNISHFSAYALTVEPNTHLEHLIRENKIPIIEDQLAEEHFKILQKKAEEMGYVQYEISNFCKDSMFSKHNSSYWKKKWYLGIGPSAHSFNESERQWNMANNSKYITNIKNKKSFFETECLNEKEKYNEYVLTSLRTIWGVEAEYLNSNFNEKINRHFQESCQKWILNKKMLKENEIFKLTKEGMLFADAISSDLFFL